LILPPLGCCIVTTTQWSGAKRRHFIWIAALPLSFESERAFFHTWRIASPNEVALLVFDRSFDFFNLPSRRLSPLRLSRPGADWIFFLLACAERTLYFDTSGALRL
jgi:hypothetical protein